MSPLHLEGETDMASSSSHMLDPQTRHPTSDNEHSELVDCVTILYASETGNAQDVAERVGREFRRKGRRAKIVSMTEYDIFELPDTPLLVLITSTHGRGDPPPAMLPLWNALLRASLPEDILEDVHFTLFGLGDTSYDKFNYAGKLLHRRMLALGAKPLLEPAYGDERAPDGIEEALVPWLRDTVNVMSEWLEVVPGWKEKDIWQLNDPIYALHWQDQDLSLESGEGFEHLNLDGPTGEAANGNHTDMTSAVAPGRGEDLKRGAGPAQVKPKDWVWARLKSNKRVTSDDWYQDVREIEFEFEDDDLEPYLPGSICSLQPQASPAEVTEFFDTHPEMAEVADQPFRLSSSLPEQPLPPHLPPSGQLTTLRSLLTNHLDLRATPRKSFFEWLRRISQDEREVERLDDFLSDPDEIFTYAARPKRTILETLADFRETSLPLSHLLEIIPPLRRRQFSIASSSTAHPGRVQLLVALVEYKTNLKVPRRGLCSSWLKDLPLGARLPIHVAPPTLFMPPSRETPVILIGPGTGVAPMRAFLEERDRQGALDYTMLYFGHRTSSDAYFADEWDASRAKGAKIRVAVSREGAEGEQRYVQGLIKQDKELIREWLVNKNAWVYISGSSNAMPREVREALAWCISTEGAGDLGSDAAKAFVEDIFDSGRGGEETW